MGHAARRSRDATRRCTSGSPSEGTVRTRRRRAGRSSSRSRNTARWWPRSRPISASPTTSRFASSLGCVLALAGGAVGARPAPGQHLSATEVGAGATVVGARRWFSGGEIGVARRPGGQGRFGLTAAGGSYDGAPGVRLAAGAQFLLAPGARSGARLYSGIGTSVDGATPWHGGRYRGWRGALV